MKSQKGVALTSIMIYVIAMTIIVGLIVRITTYFYKNVDSIDSSTSSYSEYMKFNTYFTEEINETGNRVFTCKNDEIDEDGKSFNYIIFYNLKNANQKRQYTFIKDSNGGIYFNKIKICENVDDCSFSYDKDTGVIGVDLKINEEEYNLKYTICK